MRKSKMKDIKELYRDIRIERDRRDLLIPGLSKMSKPRLVKVIKDFRINISEFRNDRVILEAERVEPLQLGGK